MSGIPSTSFSTPYAKMHTATTSSTVNTLVGVDNAQTIHVTEKVPQSTASSSSTPKVPSSSSVTNDQTSAFKMLSTTNISLNAHSAQIPIYSMENDRTLPTVVIGRGHFGIPSDYREKAIPIGTIDSNDNFHSSPYTSGFHEVVPTTTIKKYNKEFNSTQGTATTTSSGYNRSSLEMILDVSSSFRTDTARTLMSFGSDGVAAHTHALLDSTHDNQKYAHDALTNTMNDIATLDPNTTTGLTKESIACVIGSIAVSSMAPAESIEKFDLINATGKRLRDESAPSDWETNRNIAKSRVLATISTLSPDEQNFVKEYGADFLKNVGRPQALKRAVSLDRDGFATQTKSKFGGGATLAAASSSTGGISITSSSSTVSSVSLALRFVDVYPPKLSEHLGLYMTQSLRAPKW